MPKKTHATKIDGDPPKTRGQRRKAPAGGQGARKTKKASSGRSAKPAVPWYHPDSPLRAELMRGLMTGLSLRAVCETVDGLPAPQNVLEAVRRDQDLAEQYARAREIGYLGMADEIIEIADDGRNDWMASVDPDNPGYTENGEALRRSEIRINTRKWMLSKVLPKIYGDRVDHNVTTTELKEVKVTFVDAPARPRAKYIDGAWVDVTPEEGGEGS